jgi:hypothetical protein
MDQDIAFAVLNSRKALPRLTKIAVSAPSEKRWHLWFLGRAYLSMLHNQLVFHVLLLSFHAGASETIYPDPFSRSVVDEICHLHIKRIQHILCNIRSEFQFYENIWLVRPFQVDDSGTRQGAVRKCRVFPCSTEPNTCCVQVNFLHHPSASWRAIGVYSCIWIQEHHPVANIVWLSNQYEENSLQMGSFGED